MAQFGGAGENRGYALFVGDDGTVYLAGVAGTVLNRQWQRWCKLIVSLSLT